MVQLVSGEATPQEEEREQEASVTAARPSPREFFERIVLPTVEESRRNPRDERLARQALSELNNLAERVFHHWGAGVPEVYGATNVSDYRTQLAVRECSDFQLVRDIADAHKHVELGRPGRQVTRDDQTASGSLGYGEGRYGEGLYGGVEQPVVRLDDGSRRAVLGIIESVFRMWERITPQ